MLFYALIIRTKIGTKIDVRTLLYLFVFIRPVFSKYFCFRLIEACWNMIEESRQARHVKQSDNYYFGVIPML